MNLPGPTVAVVLCTMLVAPGIPGAAQTLVPGGASQVVTVRDLKATDEVVSGTVVNRSPRTLRDVRLMIRHTWLWKNERTPGHDSPGRTAYHVVPDDISPRGHVRFEHRPVPPLPRRDDGWFTTTVEVVGYTEVGF